MTNQQVERYGETKHDGDWQTYLDHWAQQLEKIQSMQFSRKAA